MSESKFRINRYGTKRWYNEEGKYHRIDGPAIEWSDGYKEWWVNGVRYTEEEFNELVKMSNSNYAVYKYKCRHCGKVYKSATESGVNAAERILINSIYSVDNVGKRVSMMEVHKCSPTSYGIADLVGVDIIEGVD
jgi:hypothetical protein